MKKKIKIEFLTITAFLLFFLTAVCASGGGKSDDAEKQSAPARITVDTGIRYQYVRGFGGMSNAWSSPVMNTDDVTTMFGENGLGYNIFRIMIYPDRGQWGNIIPVAKKAQEYGAIILASPWTPPPEIKSNNSNKGGRVPKSNFAAYAEHLRSYVNFMAENGVKIDVISFQNEPDIQVSYDSCDWSSSDMLDFVIQHGREIGDVLIIPGEPYQFSRGFYNPLLNNPEAAEKFDIVGGHIYGGGLSAFNAAAEKGKEVWMTEHLINSDGKGSFYNDITWSSAMVVADEIHNCMNASFNAYIWWYLKRFYSMIGDGEYNTVEGQTTHRGYVMSHYAKYATGKHRVNVKINGNISLKATAYDGDEGISLVIINSGGKPSDVTVLLPEHFDNVSAAETDGNGSMRQLPVRAGTEENSAVLQLAPKSITSVLFKR